MAESRSGAGEGRTVWADVCAQARESPGAVALREVADSGEVRDLTYTELVGCAAKLSEELAGLAGPGTLIALDAATPTEGAIAILAAGAADRAILPLSADLPPLLRREVLADARPAVLLAPSADGELRADPVSEWAARQDLGGVAYVLYTSGSTGRPKGVVVPHEALRRRLRGLSQVPGLRTGESMLAMTALSFDIALAEILLPLAVGGTVISASPAARLDPGVFAEFAERFQPDVLQATPSFWRLALAWGWRGCPNARIWCGGEPLTAMLAERLLPMGRELWNLYGPTEATIWVTADRVASDQPIRLGHPLPGSGLFIDEDEIWLYGAGLARGYLDRDDLTRERFQLRQTPEGRHVCYRTGDRGQYREDGTVEFLGRTDHQVKLRGYRIELGEVEAVLEECPGVSQTAVLVASADVPERAQLVAFLVTDGETTTAFVRRWAAERLPPMMRPARILLRSALPRTTAGKVDRERLAAACSQDAQ